VAPAIEGRCLLDQKHYPEAAARRRGVASFDPNNPRPPSSCSWPTTTAATAPRPSAEGCRAGTRRRRAPGIGGCCRCRPRTRRCEALERAGQLDPSADPYASYYAGLAWQAAQDREKARETSAARARTRGGRSVGGGSRSRAREPRRRRQRPEILAPCRSRHGVRQQRRAPLRQHSPAERHLPRRRRARRVVGARRQRVLPQPRLGGRDHRRLPGQRALRSARLRSPVPERLALPGSTRGRRQLPAPRALRRLRLARPVSVSLARRR
jgi:hypothetical protein